MIASCEGLSIYGLFSNRLMIGLFAVKWSQGIDELVGKGEHPNSEAPGFIPDAEYPPLLRMSEAGIISSSPSRDKIMQRCPC